MLTLAMDVIPQYALYHRYCFLIVLSLVGLFKACGSVLPFACHLVFFRVSQSVLVLVLVLI